MKVLAELSVRLNARAPFSFEKKFEDFTFLLILPQGIENATSTVREVEVRIEMHVLLPARHDG